jgi:hypothetical protein
MRLFFACLLGGSLLMLVGAGCGGGEHKANTTLPTKKMLGPSGTGGVGGEGKSQPKGE